MDERDRGGNWQSLSTDKGIDNVEVVSCTPELHNDIGPLSNLSKLYLYGGGKNC